MLRLRHNINAAVLRTEMRGVDAWAGLRLCFAPASIHRVPAAVSGAASPALIAQPVRTPQSKGVWQ